ncbi:MAG: glycosyltransferase [Dehalococcoidia bacterium]|nr:glycosyltransferase [Dehalococcoidia bacterium]
MGSIKALVHSLLAGPRRALAYYQRYGWLLFASRLLHVRRWLPRLLSSPRPAARSPVTPAQLAQLPFGINIIGYISGNGSMAESARLAAAACAAAGIPMSLYDITLPDAADRQETDLVIQDRNPYRFNVSFWLPSSSDMAFLHGRDLMAGRYNIIFRPWEFYEIPEAWRRLLPEHDEIWAPSTFVRAAFAPQIPLPVTCIPHPMPLRSSERLPRSPHLASIPADATVFLFIFNYTRSSYGRKNPEALISAFKQAFSPADNAWLVIKARFRTGRIQKRKLQTLAAGANVLFIDAWLDPTEMDALMASCDCYVSLHRTEGFGLTMADAMSFGKPVIATSYSGNMDFTTPENSYLVGHRIVPVEKDHGFFKKGWLWAEPDIGQAAAFMRHVYEHPDEARLLGERARAGVRRQLSFEAVGELMKQRLIEISAGIEKSQPAAIDT